jgi:hypothetical protein
MSNINEAINVLVDTMKSDYVRFISRDGTRNDSITQDMIDEYDIVVEEGRSYYKLVNVTRNQRSAAGFICKKDNPKKGFVVGDMLMASSWSAPATNFKRGNVFEDARSPSVRWTGIQ